MASSAGQQSAEVGGVAAKKQVEHIHQRHGLTGCGEGRCQRRVGAEVGRPHEHRINDKTSNFDAAQVLEGVDEAPKEHHAVQFQRIIEQPAEGKAAFFEQVPQSHHQHKAQRQHQREHQVILRRAQHGRTALPQRPKRAEAQRHEPDIQEAVHDDGSQREADAAFHAAAGEHRAKHIAQVEGQHKVEGIAAGHTAQHLPAGRALINADELLPPQQAERMPHQHKKQR